MKRILLLVLILMSCSKKQDIDIQGHRGCRGLLPENSMPAFIKAIELGVHTLELDLAISKDKKVVVSHEPFMSRKMCLDAFGNEIPESMEMMYNLYQMTYDEIKQFDCGLKFHSDYPNQEKITTYKPLLSEVIKESQKLNSEIKYNIEIKAKPKYDGTYTPHPEEFVNLVLKDINNYDVFKTTNLQSFDLRILEEIKRQAPKMVIAILIDDDEDIETKLSRLSFAPEIISPYYKLLTKENTTYYQQKGFKIIPWTVNQDDDLKQIISYKVDGVITDYPDRLIKILN